MKRSNLIALLLSALLAPAALAQSGTTYLSIPSSGFTPQTSEGTGDAGYVGNVSGTARHFSGSSLMFAPVNLPDLATVTGLGCGGAAPVTDLRLVFTLRRNRPQIANVDMATAATTYDGVGFEGPVTISVSKPVVNNRFFNYYIVAEVDNQGGVDLCPTCSIGFCRIGYIDPNIIFSDGFETGE